MAASAEAARFRVTSGTMAVGDHVIAGDGRIVPRRRLVQSLGLLAGGMGGGRWTFTTDLRIAADAGLADADARPRGVDARTVDLQHGYLRGTGLMAGRLDLTLGRQLHWSASDLVAIDGAHVAVRGPYHLGAEAFSGLLVRREASWLGYSDLEPDGTALSSEQSPTVGAGLMLHGLRRASARAGWRRSWRGDRLSSERVHGAAEVRVLEAVRLQAAGSWDVSLERAELARIGWILHVEPGLQLGAEAARVRPVFELDSIFPYFAGGPSDDLSATARQRVGRVVAHARATHRIFHGFEPDSSSSESESARGGGGGLQVDIGGSSLVAASGWAQRGYGGDWTSGMIQGASHLFGEALEVDGRLRWTRFEADLLSHLRGDALQAMGGAGWWLTDVARFHLTFEADVTPFSAPSLRGFALLDLALWP